MLAFLFFFAFGWPLLLFKISFIWFFFLALFMCKSYMLLGTNLTREIGSQLYRYVTLVDPSCKGQGIKLGARAKGRNGLLYVSLDKWVLRLLCNFIVISFKVILIDMYKYTLSFMWCLFLNVFFIHVAICTWL